MPRLPDVTELGGRPIPQRTGGIVSYRPTHGAETAPGEALAGLGRTIAGIGRDIEQILAQEKDHADKLRAEDAFNAIRSHALDLKVGEDGFTTRKGSNAVNQPLLAEYTNRYDTFVKDVLSKLDNDEQREAVSSRAAIVGLEMKQGILHHIAAENERYAKQVYDGALSVELQNAAEEWRSPNAVALSIERIRGVIDENADNRGLADDIRKAIKINEESKIHDTVIRQALAAGDLGYAKTWYNQHKDMIAPQTAERLQNAFDRVRANMDRRLERQIKSLNSVILSGFDPKEDQIAAIVAAARGTDLEADALQMAATAKATGQFRRMTPVQQEAYLTRLEAEIRKDPSKFDIDLIGKFRSIQENQKRLLDISPVAFAVRQGIVDPSEIAAQPLDLANPDGQALRERYDLAREMRAKYGSDFKPLTPGEQEALTEALKSSKWPEKLAYFGRIQAASGDDFDGYKAVMAQLAPDDPVTAIAGVYAARNRMAAAAQMLRGQEILRPPKDEDGKPAKGKIWPMPTDANLRLTFDSEVGEAYAGQPRAYSDSFQAAKAIYAAATSDLGVAREVVDHDLWKEAIRLAVGGVEDWNGTATIMPYGMTKRDFKDGLYKRIDQLVLTRVIPTIDRYRLRDMPLKAVGDGKYAFLSGSGYLVDENGDRVVIDFNHPDPEVDYKLPPVKEEVAEYQESIAEQRLGM